MKEILFGVTDTVHLGINQSWCSHLLEHSPTFCCNSIDRAQLIYIPVGSPCSRMEAEWQRS